jgi:hypothetical protein
MITVRDASMLALTKLRTRKIRLSITIIVSGLLFSGLAGASFVARGVMNGVNDFGKEGLGDRFIAQASSQTGFNFMSDPAILDRATAIHNDLVARKKAEAKRLGITYDSASDPSPVNEYKGPDGSKQRYLDASRPAGRQAALEYLAAHTTPNLETLKKVAASYGPKAYYQSKLLPYDLQGAQLQVLKDGKENFDLLGNNKVEGGPPSGIESFVQSWTAISSDLLTPFILPDQTLTLGKDGSIPVLVPHSAAEQLLGLKALPASASSADRLTRTKEIRAKAPSVTFSVCYRNSTSTDLVRQAVSTQQEIDRNKNNKNYQKPSLIYGTPTQACGSVPITRDVRSKNEKTLADKQEQFDQLFGTPAAAQTNLTFRIVGIVPDADYGPAFGIGQIIRSLVSSSLGSGWYTPAEEIAKKPLLNDLFNKPVIFGSPAFYFAEFGSSTNTKNFIDQQGCSIDYSKIGKTDPSSYCIAQGKPFQLGPYGSNSLALESAKKNFGKFFRIAALVICAIAAIIMMGTVGRMIADSRRETAVFRAIGAKKLDISQIYIFYTVCLALLVSLFAIVVGLGLALYADHRWSPDLTVQALTAYNAQDLNKTFSVYAFYLPDLLLLIGLALGAGLVSAVLPLFRNLRRNPIRDMRDDT